MDTSPGLEKPLDLTDTAAIVVMAQRIPEEFDGILAGAPAINWAKFLVSEAWGYVKAAQYGNRQAYWSPLVTSES